MLLAAGGGLVAGALIGTGVGWAAGVGAAEATTAAVTGAGALEAANTTCGGDMCVDETQNVVQSVQEVIPSVENAASQVADDIIQMPASAIRLTQSSISPYTKAGVPLDTLTDEISNGFFKGAIWVTEYTGKWWSLDNRRLAAFKLLDADVPVKIVQFSEVAKEFSEKFTTVTDGLSIAVRNTGLISR